MNNRVTSKNAIIEAIMSEVWGQFIRLKENLDHDTALNALNFITYCTTHHSVLNECNDTLAKALDQKEQILERLKKNSTVCDGDGDSEYIH